MEKQNTAVFAVPYIHNLDDEEEIFFITFKTTDEDEARTLSRCITDVNNALVILDKNGYIW